LRLRGFLTNWLIRAIDFLYLGYPDIQATVRLILAILLAAILCRRLHDLLLAPSSLAPIVGGRFRGARHFNHLVCKTQCLQYEDFLANCSPADAFYPRNLSASQRLCRRDFAGETDSIGLCRR
jgi:hypothetical protein